MTCCPCVCVRSTADVHENSAWVADLGQNILERLASESNAGKGSAEGSSVVVQSRPFSPSQLACLAWAVGEKGRLAVTNPEWYYAITAVHASVCLCVRVRVHVCDTRGTMMQAC